ncbi:hypothetical protein [Streptomyces salinarius]|uniref:Uncharacterized protein n=1 Tax=Streptomyces salinarius TaxID=2762598 RepID=A0ABW8BJ74_9ACTN
MFLVQLHVTTTTGLPPGHGDGHALQDLLWAHAAPWHQLEHVTVRPTFDGFSVVLFIAASTHHRATVQATGLLVDADNSGLLKRYRVSAVN